MNFQTVWNPKVILTKTLSQKRWSEHSYTPSDMNFQTILMPKVNLAKTLSQKAGFFSYLKYRTTSVSVPSSISTPSRIERAPYTRKTRPYKLFECFWIGKDTLLVF